MPKKTKPKNNQSITYAPLGCNVCILGVEQIVCVCVCLCACACCVHVHVHVCVCGGCVCVSLWACLNTCESVCVMHSVCLNVVEYVCFIVSHHNSSIRKTCTMTVES